MTSRCKTTKLPIYGSQSAAEKAITKVRTLANGVAFQCDHSRHWHVRTVSGSDAGKTSIDRWTKTEWDAATMLLWARCRDMCEWCGQPLRSNLERHHRQVREVGGDRLANLIAVHTVCHGDIHSQPELARERGAIVSRHASDPATVPLTLPGGRLVLLDDEGKYLPTT